MSYSLTFGKNRKDPSRLETLNYYYFIQGFPVPKTLDFPTTALGVGFLLFNC